MGVASLNNCRNRCRCKHSGHSTYTSFNQRARKAFSSRYQPGFRYHILGNPPIFLLHCLPFGPTDYSSWAIHEIPLQSAVWNHHAWSDFSIPRFYEQPDLGTSLNQYHVCAVFGMGTARWASPAALPRDSKVRAMNKNKKGV